MFKVEVTGDNLLLMSLEASDVSGPASVYVVKITGESKNYFFQFQEQNDSLPAPLIFNATYHGLYYIVTLMVVNANLASRPTRSVTVLTKPLPVSRLFVRDYKPSPETGVVFEVEYPEKFNVFTRVNISYWEGASFRTVLYKDFFKGKTVFNHWLPGMCYTDITFQLVSEASFNKTTLMESSGTGHEPQQHRTAPYPPQNISVQILYVNVSFPQDPGVGNFAEAVGLGPSLDPSADTLPEIFDDDTSAYNATSDKYPSNGSSETTAPPYWWGREAVTGDLEGFVNEIPLDYENPTTASILAGPALDLLPPAPGFRASITWLPPKVPTAFDGFTIYIHRDGNVTLVSSVDENTHEFITELRDPGKYSFTVATFSSSGACDSRESSASKPISFYLSPDGKWFEELTEKPKNVTATILNSTTAMISWSPAPPDGSPAPILAVTSLTCLKPKESQRLEKHFCKEVNVTGNIISNLVPGAQYRVVVYLRKPPLIGPPSEPLIVSIEPPGIRDLVLYPFGPSSVVLSWTRPYRCAFRKYVVEMFYFNPLSMTSEWTPYYEIAATVSLISTVRLTNLLPAWYYNFRVTMVTWGDPEQSCCDSSTISYITAPVSPRITQVEYMKNLLYITWQYGERSWDLSHSRMLHWQVTAEGKKRIKKSVSRNMMTAVMALPAGDIYNLTVTAFTERSSNSSAPYTVTLDPAPPKSLFAVNKTQTSVTLLWVEEGISDYFEVFCWGADSAQAAYEKDPVTVFSHVVTISNLQPGTSYNCSISSVSHRSASVPTYITISTLVAEMNPNVVVISLLAVLSILLIALLLVTLVVLRRKHLQMSRECGAGTFVNFATLERDAKLPYNWRRSIFAFLTLLPSCLWTDYLLAFYINPWNKNGFKKRKLTNPVQLDDFDSYMADMCKDSDYKFSLQFEELKMIGLDIPHCAADLPANRCKNRYTNILPYDFSRVKLISTNEEDEDDYINANYIAGYNSAQEYIATQGPLPDTRNDFWRMILQQKSQVIVMLTQCNEKRRIKCDHYWPFTSEAVSYGDIRVEMASEDEQRDWALRVFRVSHAEESHHVLHFSFTAWPDHGVPAASAAESILHFVHMVRQKATKTKGPITVHCSAGVGRTGTFIALDRLMQHIRDHEYVDVLGLVAELRSYRMCMVQTEEQFVFIHQCVQLMWRKKKQQFRISDVIYENVTKS
ncbi:receptor-type tyrosine-protein phosphatase O [Gastrophryne carolinensis]